MTTRRLRGSAAQDVLGRLKTQSGPRSLAPMWVRPLLTVGEWAVYSALWSYPTDSVFPSHQDLADRAWVERGTAADAVAKFDREGLLAREANQREDGSDTTNTYYLIELPTEKHLAQIAKLQAERAVEQDKKRKQRKAANRASAAKTAGRKQSGDAAEGEKKGYGTDRTPPDGGPDGGTAQAVPRGSGEDRTPGGTAQAVPGYGTGRTHESLGVKDVSKGTVRTSPPPTPSESESVDSSPAEGGRNQQEQTQISSEIENQEWKMPRDWYPELTAWEQELHAECMAIRPDWLPRHLRQVLGAPPIRERTEINPELVRRAFLIGARCVRAGHKPGTVTPKRLLFAACPHWAQAAEELRAEQESGQVAADPSDASVPAESDPAAAPEQERGSQSVSTGGDREPDQVPDQRQVLVASKPGRPGQGYRETMRVLAEQREAARRAEEAAEEERRKRHASVMANALTAIGAK